MTLRPLAPVLRLCAVPLLLAVAATAAYGQSFDPYQSFPIGLPSGANAPSIKPLDIGDVNGDGISLGFATTAAVGRADYIAGAGGLEGLGTYAGQVVYTASDSGHATLTIDLWNTSPTAGGGFLTAFAFHNPSGRITGATLATTNANFGLLGGPGYQGGIHASPFGSFDLGASVTDDFLGGGAPVGGIATGEFATFTFALTGVGLDGLTEQSFFGAEAAAGGSSQGPVALLARFRGFANGGGDKVPGGLEDVGPPAGGGLPSAPKPGTLTLAGIATAAGLSFGCRSVGRDPRS